MAIDLFQLIVRIGDFVSMLVIVLLALAIIVFFWAAWHDSQIRK